MQDTAPAAPDPDRNRSLAAKAEQLLSSRRLRDAMFCQHIDGLGEPGWDMLLSLFVADSSVHAEELVAATATADEIARPYILWLASRRLVEVSDDRVTLTVPGRALMVAYLQSEVDR